MTTGTDAPRGGKLAFPLEKFRGEKGDYLYYEGAWYYAPSRGTWEKVTDADTLTDLEDTKKYAPALIYAMTDLWGEVLFFDHVVSPEERQQQMDDALLFGPPIVDVPPVPNASDFENTYGTLTKDGRAAYNAAVAERAVAVAAANRRRNWEAQQKIVEERGKRDEEARKTDPQVPMPTEEPKPGFQWEWDKSQNRWYEERAPVAKETISDFTKWDDAAAAAERMGPWAYAVPDGKGGFTIEVDEAQRRQSMAPQEQPRLASFDDRIMEAFQRGDYAQAYQIDQFRDMLGADRNAIANQVMGFYLDNATAAQVEEYIRNPPPLLAQAIQQWASALNPMGMVPVGQVMQQNAQAPSWMELAQMYAAAGGKVEYGPDGKKLAEPITRETFPQGPAGIPRPTGEDFTRGKVFERARAEGMTAEDFAINPQTGQAYTPNFSTLDESREGEALDAFAPLGQRRQDIYNFDPGENDLRGLPMDEPAPPTPGQGGRTAADAMQSFQADRQSIYSLDETGAPGPISTRPAQRDIYAREAMDEPTPPTPGQGGRDVWRKETSGLWTHVSGDNPYTTPPEMQADPDFRKAQGWDTVDTSTEDYRTDVDAYMRQMDLDRPTAERYALSNQMQKAQEASRAEERRQSIYAQPPGADVASILGPIAKAKREREYKPRVRRVIYG